MPFPKHRQRGERIYCGRTPLPRGSSESRRDTRRSDAVAHGAGPRVSAAGPVGRIRLLSASFAGATLGGTGAASDFSWETTIVGRYSLRERWSLAAGCRALGYERETRGVALDVIMHGPVVGFIDRF